ncbi:MAG: hypothetical protein Q8N10_20845 [Phenylobacterium sp.]|nr:hypothetical protein [Phenylobacterium sp.]MDO8911940.1 hypothetical protein [Phenylobacterium sp.]MDO9247223.1 hypothetical protein [Phenylobacterium sp.]MDP2011031.1 hypothetical protein [Phenylobacterium sp.]MDP3102942.1 hypothetical protein [Phenylobacterium sp.]MDP3633858.1 hypothetical protein [Phenylobacterium sp.]
MALKVFFLAATFAAVLVGLALPTGRESAQVGESQIATMALGEG